MSPDLPTEIATMEVQSMGAGCAHVVAVAPDGVRSSGTLIGVAPHSPRGYAQIVAALAVARAEGARG